VDNNDTALFKDKKPFIHATKNWQMLRVSNNQETVGKTASLKAPTVDAHPT